MRRQGSIDDIVATRSMARVREASDVQQHKKKALLVDCEQVHTDGADVTEFIIGATENGSSQSEVGASTEEESG